MSTVVGLRNPRAPRGGVRGRLRLRTSTTKAVLDDAGVGVGVDVGRGGVVGRGVRLRLRLSSACEVVQPPVPTHVPVPPLPIALLPAPWGIALAGMSSIMPLCAMSKNSESMPRRDSSGRTSCCHAPSRSGTCRSYGPRPSSAMP